MKLRILAIVILVAGCGGSPIEPDPPGPAVLLEPVTIEIPVPVRREPDPELLLPLNLQAPKILPAGQGDYGLTRADLELIIEALRAAGERLARWRAWAQ